MLDQRERESTPLLSVRRFSMASSSFSAEEEKKNTQNSIFQNESESIFDQVTEPVAVPFHWEFIPGRSKNGHDEPEKKLPTQSHKASITPNLLQYSKVDDQRQNSLGNERESEDFEKHDGYSDVSETLSSSDSLSLHNFSISGLSGSDGLELKPSGSFSIDPQTLAFMMARFLPAASAVAINTANYASRKQLVDLPGKPRNKNFETSIGLTNRLPELIINPPTDIEGLACVRPPRQNFEKFGGEHKLSGSPKVLELKSAVGDLISRSRSSPLRHSKGASLNRIEHPESLLEVPKANMLDCVLVPGDFKSDFDRTEIDKRLRVDSVKVRDISSSSSNFPNFKRKTGFTGDKTGTRKVIEENKEIATVESHSRQGNPESPKAGESNPSELESPSSTMYEQHEPGSASLQFSKSRNEDNEKPREALDKTESKSHRPPLPKSPPESWLRLTLPSISSETSSWRSILSNRRQSEIQNAKTPSAGTSKWETIVKTSNRRRDHSRYSEELVPRVSQHYKS